MSTDPILFNDFKPGTTLGTHDDSYAPRLAENWRRVFASEGAAAEAAGMAVALMMRGYLNAVKPRPPGNVHARQRLTLTSLPEPGEVVRTTVSCTGKEVRRERRYVDLEVRAVGKNDRPLFVGHLTMIWAA